MKTSVLSTFLLLQIFLLNGRSASPEELVSTFYHAGLKGKVEIFAKPVNEEEFSITWPSEAKYSCYKGIGHLKSPFGYQSGNAITYSLTGGQFGDNLVSYCHALWIAYREGLPFLYQPFDKCKSLSLVDVDLPVSFMMGFKNRVTMKEWDPNFLIPSSTLITVPYFPESLFDYQFYGVNGQYKGISFFEIDWEDPGFKKEAMRRLNPKKSFKTIELPMDQITVGVHVRRPANPAHLPRYISKMPPDSYYIEQIKRLVKIFPDWPLYIYIITNDSEPESVAERYRKALKNPLLTFDCRPNDAPPQDDLEEFYLMSKFDCLIYSRSNFSVMASKLGDYCLTITPGSYDRKTETFGVIIEFNGDSSHVK